MQPGDLIDLPASSPRACVYFTDDGAAWATARTRRKPRVEGWVPYRVIGPVDDPDVFDVDHPPLPPAPPEPVGLALIREAFGDIEVVSYDTARMRHAVAELLAHYDARDPDVFEDPRWLRLVEVDDGADEDLVAAAEGVVSWCRQRTPERMGRAGWRVLVELIDAYRIPTYRVG